MDDVLTIIVSFNGARTIKDTLKACHAAAARWGPVVIVDNGSTDDTVKIARSLALSRVHIEQRPVNVGVAAAYNLGLARAQRRGVRWLFILDQDSQCEADCLDILLAEAEQQGDAPGCIGALCPTVKNTRFPGVIHYPLRWQGTRYHPVVADPCRMDAQQPIGVDSTITSGTLYSVAALGAVNGFCEKYFIDFVDHECHMRLRQKGFCLLWVPCARIRHQLGYRQVMTPQGLWIEHQPYRYYYMVRNMFDGYRRLAGLRALGCFGMDSLWHYIRIWRCGKAPVLTLGYILKGLWHAVCGKFGALNVR